MAQHKVDPYIPYVSICNESRALYPAESDFLYQDVRVHAHAVTVSTFHSDGRCYKCNDLPEKKLNDLTTAYYSILESHDRKLQCVLPLGNPRLGKTIAELRRVCDECVKFLLRRVENTYNANDKMDVAWCWKKIAEFHRLMWDSLRFLTTSREYFALALDHRNRADDAYKTAISYAKHCYHLNDAAYLFFHESYADFKRYALCKLDESFKILENAIIDVSGCGDQASEKLRELRQKQRSWREATIEPPSNRHEDPLPLPQCYACYCNQLPWP